MDFCKHRIMDKCQKNNRPCIFDDDCFEPEEIKPQTNADRIRAMSDEELAEEIGRSSILDMCDIVCGGDCKAVATFNKTLEQRCAEFVLDWLRQPAEEG